MFLSGGCLEGNVKREAWQVQYARNGESTANLRKQAKPLNKKIKLRHGVVDAVAQPRREAPLFISIFFWGKSAARHLVAGGRRASRQLSVMLCKIDA